MPKIFAMDIGAGTADILYYDSGKVFENNLKMEVPTEASVLGKKIKELEGDISFSGRTIGGGPFASAVMKHLKKGYRVRMTKAAGYSIKNNIKEVMEKGIEIGGRLKGRHFVLEEINLRFYEKMLQRYDETLKNADALCVALQDHGAAPYGVSDRAFRFDNYIEAFSAGRTLGHLAYINGEIPRKFLRMRSAYGSIKSFTPFKNILIMDTAPAAILGAMADLPKEDRGKPALYMNFGNIHTLIVCIRGEEILSIFEHHTHMIKEDLGKFSGMIKRMLTGELSREEVFDDWGNGALTFEKTDLGALKHIIVTGPNRRFAAGTGLPFKYAAPGGDMMITGPIGLVCAAYGAFGFGEPSFINPAS